MDVETPNVSVTTNDERTPLIPHASRSSNEACRLGLGGRDGYLFGGCYFLGRVRELAPKHGRVREPPRCGRVPGDSIGRSTPGDSIHLGGWRSAWNRVTETVSNVVQFDWEGTANKFEKAMNDAKADATSKANEIVQLKHQITDLTGVINAVKNMHKLSDLQNNAIIPPDIKNAVSTVVDSIHGVKRDVFRCLQK